MIHTTLPAALPTPQSVWFVALLALLLRFVHIRENKKLEAAEREGIADPAGVGLATVGASSDRRAKTFRYVY